jgi:tetratricopeptide (TPR) repeat protein
MVTEAEKPSGRRKRPVDAAKKYWWASAIVVPVVVAIGAALINKWPIGGGDASPVPGATYIGSMTVIGKQYEHFSGEALSDPALKQKIQQAVELGAKREFQGAIALFEQIPESARVPAVWNDLGVAYAGLNDQQRARAAFEKAREKSPDDAAAKANLSRLDELKVLPLKETETAVSDREIEPNNDFFHANKIPLNAAIGAAIADPADVDFFVFTTPPVYRDMIDIVVNNESTTLQPALDMYNSDRSRIGGNSNGNPAGNVSYSFVAPPNSLFYVRVRTADYTSSSGAYTLKVNPRKAYDAYEPNNDIFHAAPIAIGQTIEAGIMVGDEVDFYQVKSDKAASLVVSLDNHSTSLQPVIEIYDADRSRIGGNANSNPAGNVSYSFAAQPNSAYYIKVRTADYTSSSGAYRLTVRPQ